MSYLLRSIPGTSVIVVLFCFRNWKSFEHAAFWSHLKHCASSSNLGIKLQGKYVCWSEYCWLLIKRQFTIANCLCGRCTTVPYSLSAMFCRTRFFYFRPSPSQIIVFAQQFSTYTSSWVTRPFLSSQLFLRNFYELFPFFTFHFSFLPPDAIMRTTQCLRRQFCPTVETWAMSAARTIDLRTRTSPNELLRIVRWCGKRKRRGNRFPGRRGWWVMDSSSAASRRCHWRRLAVPATDDWWLSVYAKQWCMRRRARRDRINWRFHCTGWPRKRKPLPQSHHHHHHHHHHHLIRWKQIQSKYKYK